jgi:hypothetical protein
MGEAEEAGLERSRWWDSRCGEAQGEGNAGKDATSRSQPDWRCAAETETADHSYQGLEARDGGRWEVRVSQECRRELLALELELGVDVVLGERSCGEGRRTEMEMGGRALPFKW